METLGYEYASQMKDYSDVIDEIDETRQLMNEAQVAVTKGKNRRAQLTAEVVQK